MTDVLRLGKKAFTVSVVITTILWSIGVAAFVAPLVATAADVTLTAGDVIKGVSTKNVFYYSADGKRYTFPSDKVFFSYFKDWTVVKTIPDTQLGNITIGGTLPYRAGTQLIKIQTDPKVYAVEPAGTIRWIETEAIALSLYGSLWAKKIHDVGPEIFPYVYTVGASVNTATYPAGSLVKSGADTYYIVSATSKQKVTTDGMTANRFFTGNVITTALDLTGYVTGTEIAAVNTALTTLVGAAPVTTTPTTTEAGGSVTVALAADTPVSGVAPLGAIRVPFTKITFTASDKDATIDSLVFERKNLGQDAAFSSVMLVDSADQSQIGLNQTLNSSHQVTFNDDIVVKAGTTKSVLVAGNMASTGSYAGLTPTLVLATVTMKDGGLVSGTLPISGNPMTIVTTLSLGSVTVAKGSNDPSQAVTDKPLGTTGYIFSGLRLTGGSNEDLTIESIRFNQAGSAAASDLANVKVVLDGTSYDTVVSSDGKYYTAAFGTGVELKKGLNKELYLKADVLSGASRTVRFDVYRRTDLLVKGKSYSYYLSPTGTSEAASAAAGAFSTANPWYQGYLVTMASGGSLRVDKGTLVAGNIAEGSSTQVLGDFNFVVEGEAVKITQLILNLDIDRASGSVASASDFTNVTVYDKDGKAVAGPVDATDINATVCAASTAGTGCDGYVTFTDTISVPSGTNKYTIKATLSTDFTANDTVRAGFGYTTTGAAGYPSTLITAVGSGTGNTVTPAPATVIWSNYQTIKAGSLSVTVSPVPVAQNIVKGTSDFVFANYIFDASASGEDIKVTTFVPLLTVSANTYQTDITSVRLYGYDGTTDGVQLNNGSNVKNPASYAGTGTNETITLDKPLYIPKGTSKTLVLQGNVSAAAQGTSIRWGVTGVTATYITAIGKDTGAAPTYGGTAAAGQAMTVAASGQFSIALDSGRPQGGLLAAGASGVTVNKLRFTGTTEPIAITKLRLKLTDYSASSSDQDIVKAYLYDASGLKVSDGTFSGGVANFTIPTVVEGGYYPFIIDKDSEKVMTVKVDLATISQTSSIGTAGHGLVVDYDYNTDTTLNQGVGQNSGITIPAYTADTSNTGNRMYVFRSAPTVAKVAVANTTLANGSGVPIYKFKVTADAKGDVDLYKFSFKASTTSGSTGTLNISSLNLVDVTETAEVTLAASTVAPTVDAQYDMILRASPGTWSLGSTPKAVSAGTTRTFELRATITGVSAGASLVTQLEGDAAAPSYAAFGGATDIFMGSATNMDTDGANDFIWSDFSKSSHAYTTVDWYNGYLASGLPSSNLATEVLSK